MARLLASARLAHRHNWFTCRPLITSKSNLVPLAPPIVPYTQSKQAFATSSSSSMDQFSSDAPCQGPSMLDAATTRSKNSSDIQTVVLALPEVPRIPSRKRTFHLNHEDLETHVRPLLSCHWHVGQVGDGVDDLKVFSLNKLFSFKNFRSAVNFFDALADTQDEEDHHARVTVDYSNVYVSTHTHVAYQRTSDADTDAKPIRVPGLTSRDLRFAVKVERLHGAFLADEHAITKVPVDSASLQAWSMEQLRRRYPAHVA